MRLACTSQSNSVSKQRAGRMGCLVCLWRALLARSEPRAADLAVQLHLRILYDLALTLTLTLPTNHWPSSGFCTT
eukprot:scaffold124790_cov33-Phaeocystis_antarctica.AAC.1